MTGPRLGARLWWGLVPLLLLLWGSGALLTSSLPGVTTTPLVTTVLLPFVAFARDIALVLTVGALVVALLDDVPRVRRWAIGWGVAAIGLVALGAVALRADLAAEEVVALDGGVSLLDLLRDTYAGRAVVVQLACLVIAVLVTAVAQARPARWAALVIALIGVAAPAFAGHAGLSGPHGAAAVSVALHVAGVSLWVGGLAVVSAVLLLEPATAPRLLPRFSALALVCVLVVAETGLLTASLNVAALGDLLGSTYGSVVLAKAVALAWLVRLGWLQRRRAVDRLPDATVPTTVARLAGIELLTMGAALAASVVLARIGPSPVPMTGFAPLTLVALGIAAPMVLVLAVPRGWRVTDALPEVIAVVLLVVLVEVGGVGLLRVLLGGAGLVIELVLLAGAGWLAIAATRGASGRAATVILMAGLPLAMAGVVLLGDDPAPVRMAVVATIAGEVLLAAWLRRSAMTAHPVPIDSVPVAG